MEKENNFALTQKSKFNILLNKINPKNWFSFSSKNAENQTLPRRSELRIQNDKEQQELLTNCAEFCKSIKSSFKTDNAYDLLGLLYYSIGTADYTIYQRSDSPNLSKRELELYLAKRAYYSAMIQAFEDDISKRGYDVPEYYKTRIIDESPNVPETIYHGTTAKITIDELGKKDENGKYHIRDGVSYFTDEKRAQKFASIGGIKDKRNPNDSKVLAKSIDKQDCKKVEMTDGYVCFTCQNQLKEYCDKGIKYLFSHTPQILDISEFSNFINERDSSILNAINRFNLKLPNKNQSIDEYFESMKVNKYLIANTIMWTPRGISPKEHDERYQTINNMTYEDLFPTIQKSIGTNPENSFTEKLKIDRSKLKHSILRTIQTKSKDKSTDREK